MENEPTDNDSAADESRLVELLAVLRVEAVREADFEERFLYDLHERIEHEAVCRPARTLLWEHITQFINNVSGRRRLVYGTAACGLFALGSAYLAWDTMETDVYGGEGMEAAMSSLKPGVAKDVTRISVGRPSAKATLAVPAVMRTPMLFAETEEAYEAPAYSRTAQPIYIEVTEGPSVQMPDINY